MPVDLTCKTCGNPFRVPPSQSGQQFCSIACRRIPPKHGGAHTRLYNIWKSMKSRCFGKTNTNFRHYGGRGITVCDAWRDSFESFRMWAYSNGYAENLEIDRINPDLGYSPDNCRFVTHKDNNRNCRKKRPNESSSAFKGVFFDNVSKRWRAQIRGTDGKSKYLGLFNEELDAAKAYDVAAKEIQGEFARLNFPETEVSHLALS
jgi:hypothetical protein